MSDSQLTLCGYHGTCTKYRSDIDEYGLDPSKCKYRNDHWLGQGVYFFEDYSQALWWAKDIASKSCNQDSFALIYKADIIVDKNQVLNLDNNNELDEFYTVMCKIIQGIESDGEKRYPIFTPGEFRAVYLDYYKQEYNIAVIIYTFQKNAVKYTTSRTKEELSIQKELAKNLNILFKEKQICVSKKECIFNTKLVYNEEQEEEVI